MPLDGNWTRLELIDEANTADAAELESQLSAHPAIGSWRSSAHGLVPPMLIRNKKTGLPAGLVTNHFLPAGVAVLAIYLDPDRARAGSGMEAIAMYISHLFDSGAKLVAAEIFEFNRPILGVMRKLGIEVQARLREHVYIGGRLWDVLIFSFDREEWLAKGVGRYRNILPGGKRHPAAVGGRSSAPA